MAKALRRSTLSRLGNTHTHTAATAAGTDLSWAKDAGSHWLALEQMCSGLCRETGVTWLQRRG